MEKLNIRSSFQHYREKSKNPVQLTEYVELTREFNKFLINIVLQGHKVSLPHRFGSLEITGKLQKPSMDAEGNIRGLAIDWQKTKKFWEKNLQAKENKEYIYHNNSHSSKLRYKYLWSKKNVTIDNKLLYSLRMSRANKRALAQMIKKGKEY